MEKIKAGFVSLGCSKNQIDTEIMLNILVNAGYEIASEDIDADIIIVNTCAFIESAKQEAINSILDVAWLKENRSLKGIIVCGCLAEKYKDEIFKELPEVDAVIGVGSIKKIAEAADYVMEQYASSRKDNPKYISTESASELELGGDRVLTTPEYTAYIKIAEGCSNCCSYCAIPSIRGGFRSRTMESIIDEARDLAGIGVKELCVVAQDTTRYGIDLYGEYKLPELVNRLCEIEGFEWIRLLYCYPDLISDELIHVIKTQEKVVKYIDIPIQHIDDSVLDKMNRRGGSEAIKSAVTRLREAVPGIALRTTVITGFPGEGKEEFTRLRDYLNETKFERLGAFAYSQEEGTPAADFPDICSAVEREKRRGIIMEDASAINYGVNKTKLGSVIKVLCEGFDAVGEVYFGRSEHDAPDIDGKVYFKSKKKVKEGVFVQVKISDVLDYDLLGETV